MVDLSLQTFTRLNQTLRELYNFSSIDGFQPVIGGYVTKNFCFTNSGKKYFLKQYETDDTHRIRTITNAYNRFQEGEIPVIVPLQTKEGEQAFLLDNAWWSLFPFVEGTSVATESLSLSHAGHLGSMLGKIHHVGLTCPKDGINPIVLWDKEVFVSDRITLEFTYSHESKKREVDTIAIDNIRLQSQFIQNHSLPPKNVSLEIDCLIHGDFTHNNVFFDPHAEVMWIFDLDKTCVAPRAYELARSILITCFDSVWNEQSFKKAEAFLNAYLLVCPLSFTEFEKGFKMYVTHFMHMTWLEKKVILSKSEHHEPLILGSHIRLQHLLEEFDTLAQRLYPKSL